MAEVLSLVRTDASGAVVDSVNLLGSGYTPAGDGWIQAAGNEGDETVEEVITVHVEGTSHDNLASLVQSLDEKIEQVGLYRGPLEQYAVWLRAKLNNETGTRQALLLRARRSAARARSLFTRHENVLDEVQIGLERMPWWEPTAGTSYQLLGLNCLGGMGDYTTYGGSPGAVRGDVPARMSVSVGSALVGSGNPIVELWCGFRTNRYGNRTNFVPNWDCRLGTLANSTTTVAEGTARSGTLARCTFGDPSMLPRVTIETNDVTANEEDQRGSFIVLLRARLSNGSTTCRARLMMGMASGASWLGLGRVTISGTSWRLYNMGRVNLPSFGFYSLADLFYSAIRIEAERVSGSGNLDMDCLTLIPDNEGHFYANGLQVTYTPQTNGVINQRPNDSVVSVTYDALINPIAISEAQVHRGVPVGNGVAVVAGQRSGESNLNDSVNLFFSLYPRWATLRGTE